MVSNVRIARSAAEGGSDERYERTAAYSAVWVARSRCRVNSLVEADAADLEASAELDILDLDSSAARVSAVESVVVDERSFRDGRKNGAFSGAFGASFGLLRARIMSKWRRVCHRDLGTKLSVVMPSLN